MSGRRVVVTGIGVLSSIGNGAAEFTRALREGRCGAGPITRFDATGFREQYAHEVRDFEPADWIHHLRPDTLGRTTQFSLAAARMATRDADLEPDRLRETRVLVTIGTTDGEAAEYERLIETELAEGPEGMDATAVRRLPAHRLALAVVRELRLPYAAPSVLGTACAAGNYAIGDGFDAIRSGEADYALVGGADALARRTFAGFSRMGLVAPDRCRPFDAEREGLLTAEGAGVLLLEPLDSALARGARIYAELLGYGLNCDAHHPTAPALESVSRCMELALADAGVKTGEVDLVSAHGTGTKTNDVTEARAIRAVFGDEPPRTVALKSMLGHSMGAASALGAAASALALARGFIPPTVNHRSTDPECGIDCVPNHAVAEAPRVVVNNGLAFGGNNASLVLGRSDRTEDSPRDPEDPR
ncbi:beta-ketoacyl-[acyl-carrier-protein] synthase family protein [Streptomyces boncukensis]|uniref:Beta-ketoacyl-[acyl-carrier-protein] synthase family protein n=1 Tax=Streptomyces boncukensis TaxID=2711219 RepID=A0A6G4X5E7_9ACTN|nr:beta-ketoacyl-[acyl-carrier-protein] synthase family protein [Streptomyces boncukensis]NGO71891.1 beta-ketoacyl-[acyl-carrier-protein] synthase family protein [Streptomyces boncukensis]